MDRYVTRVQRGGEKEYPEGNQMIAFSATTTSTGNNITIPQNVFYGANVGDVPNVNMQVLGHQRLMTTQVQPYSPNVIQPQGQIASGIDPRYLAAYSDDNIPAYAQHSTPQPMAFNTFGSDYQNRSFIGPQTNKGNFNNHNNFNKANQNDHNFNVVNANNNNFNGAQNNDHFKIPQAPGQNFNATDLNNRHFNKTETTNQFYNAAEEKQTFNKAQFTNQHFNKTDTNIRNFNAAEANYKNMKENETITNKLQTSQVIPKVDIKKKIDNDLLKSEQPNQVKTRAEKLKELQKSGGRVFSGPVEKILKWHKSLQDIGIMVMYEIVGKCVNVRAGEACAKNLVVRDDNGPAIQVVYYEIDFFLPELKPPCTVRVIGRMMPGTNRFQAFNVRLATGDDVATLPRRAAVAAHHVAKLCKEYGVEVLVFK